jgi:hypothetical protein
MPLRRAVAAILVSSVLPATSSVSAFAAPSGAGFVPAGPGLIEKAQVGIYLEYGRPYRPYRRYYDAPYYRPYYRPYAYRYYEPAPRYYSSRPYVVEEPRRYEDPDALARCASQFRSFNAHTGTYTTYEGETRLCPYLR